MNNGKHIFWNTFLNIFWTYFFISVSSFIFAQNDLAIGDWRTHFPFDNIISLTQSEDKVYFAASQMVIIYDKEEGTVERLDKNNGLSQVGIQLIKYYSEKSLLLVAYNDGNIDIITEDAIINISDIKRYQLVSEKNIRHIHFNGDFAYMSYTFGLVQLNLVKYEVKNSFFTNNFYVNASSVVDDVIYMSTEDGIYQGNPNVNLNDFSNWIRHSTAQNLPVDYYSNVMEFFDNKLFADNNDTLMYYDGAAWQHFPSNRENNPKPFFHNENNVNRYLEASNDGKRLMLATNFFIGAIEKNGWTATIEPDAYVNQPKQVIRDKEVIYWADEDRGAIRFENWNINKIYYNAPLSKDISHLAIHNGELWMSTGGVNGSWNGLNRGLGLYSLINTEWEVHNKDTDTTFRDVNDLMPIVIRPSDGMIYSGSYKVGLAEYNRDFVKVYNKYNSELQTPPLDTFTTRVTGLAFDADENLWISNYESTRPIVVYRKDGTWENYSIPAEYATIANMVVDRNGYKWALVRRGSGGVVVFNEKAEGSASNRYRILTTGNSELPSNDVNSIAVDRDGDIWIGTNEGAVVFECSSQMFTATGCRGRKVIVEEDDFGEHLLKFEEVTAIAVDGADRKWFGTGNGIFIQSANGEKNLYRYTTENSPLPSNQIIAIAINPENGEVFIGTGEGLVSYRSDAVLGSNRHADTVLVFPNPVRPDYQGDIAIKGLVEDANVKITDIAGRLVYETTSLGGQAIWNGQDYNGRRAATGVYLVFSSNRDGLETLVSKLVFVN
jgi:hypothetical protein